MFRRLRVAFFSTGDEICARSASRSTTAASTTATATRVCGMLQRLGCEVLDLGVVRDEPAALEAAFRAAARERRRDHHRGRRQRRRGRPHQGDDGQARRRAVLEHRDAARAGRWRSAASAAAGAILFGLPGNPVAVMVTFYAFVRAALLRDDGRARPQPPPLLRAAQRRGDPQEARPHRIPARHRQRAPPTARCRCAPPAPGLGHPAQHEQANGLSCCTMGRQRRRRRARRRDAVRRVDVAPPSSIGSVAPVIQQLRAPSFRATPCNRSVCRRSSWHACERC